MGSNAQTPATIVSIERIGQESYSRRDAYPQCFINLKVVYDKELPIDGSISCANCTSAAGSYIIPREAGFEPSPNVAYAYRFQIAQPSVWISVSDDLGFNYYLGTYSCEIMPQGPYTVETFDQKMLPSTDNIYAAVYYFRIKELVKPLYDDPGISKATIADPYSISLFNIVSVDPVTGTLFKVGFYFNPSLYANSASSYLLNITSLSASFPDLISFGNPITSNTPIEILLAPLATVPSSPTGQELLKNITPLVNPLIQFPSVASMFVENVNVANGVQVVAYPYMTMMQYYYQKMIIYPISGSPSNATILTRFPITSDEAYPKFDLYYFGQNSITKDLNQFLSFSYPDQIQNEAFQLYSLTSNNATRNYEVDIGFNSETLTVKAGSRHLTLQYPFGFVSDSSFSPGIYRINLPAQNFDLYDSLPAILFVYQDRVLVNQSDSTMGGITPVSIGLKLGVIDYLMLPGSKMVITVGVEVLTVPLKKICFSNAYSGCSYSMDDTNLIDTASNGWPIYQKVVPVDFTLDMVRIIDKSNFDSQYYLYDTGNSLIKPPPFFKYNIEEISLFKFNQTIVDVSSGSVSNYLILNFTSDANIDHMIYEPTLIILNGQTTNELPDPRNVFRGKWQDEIQAYVIPFVVPIGLYPGPLNYRLPIDLELSYDYQSLSLVIGQQDAIINVVNSKGADLIPPQVVSVIKSPNNTTSFGYDIEIEDHANGFKNGTLIVMRKSDPFFNFSYPFDQSNIIQGGNANHGVYRIWILDYSSFRTADVIEIRSIETEDFGFVSTIGNRDSFTSFTIYQPTLPPPYNKEANTSLPFDRVPPIVIPPNIPATFVSDGVDRDIIFNATVTDELSLISMIHIPKAYVVDDFEVIAIVDGVMVDSNANKSSVVFQFKYTVPMRMSRMLAFYVYNFADSLFNYNGNTVPVMCDVQPINQRVPIIYYVSEPFNVKDSSVLYVYGINFGDSNFLFNFTGTYEPYSPTFSSDTLLIFNVGAIPLIQGPIGGYCDAGTFQSDIVVINPRGSHSVNFTMCASGCPQNMHCGSYGACVCNTNFYGPLCQDSVIHINPSHGSNSPDTTYNGTTNGGNGTNNGGNGGEKSVVYGKISVVELRELDLDDNVLLRHPFSTWQLDNSSLSLVGADYLLKYNTTIANNQTNVLVEVQYFSKGSQVPYLDGTLDMEPSTVKYGVSMDYYPFSQGTNTLELVMSVSLENQDASCSVVENGDLDDGFSKYQYIKTKVDDITLYGKFINLASIDDHKTVIKSRLLDESMNEIESTSTNSVAFIAISIPHYSTSIFIDPDFSLLFDKEEASESDHSICESSDDGPDYKLIGIIVGSVVGAIAIGIASVMSYKKWKVAKGHERAMKMKLNRLKV
ncbi:hypothetical protein DFA_02804 [Cavenderia fasciculata]|uniref:EGF-like domain-containing protein n=1 Tax=Cavenderia fasciculata TaxID=261658 RepID=F4PIC7_CACFS|nr:uncharacterized protein DFA_02804 [Cavenderia fasciculata]EGG24561.1 hypothetical protein DFA_02804 [Cavenderia fasciculata]|eukprot:XP_004362412.1 hypothetical protein DFA_02804 [Cavenderia fasciculata]